MAPTLKTVECRHCGESIVVPRQCKHGMKLINCRGTECPTAHITEHNRQCLAQTSKPKVRHTPRRTKSSDTERKILGALILQEIGNVERMRGKEMRYLGGCPKSEFLRNLDSMSLAQARTVAQKLKEVGEGTMGVDMAMYDDEDSDSDNGHCQTPPEDDFHANAGEDDAGADGKEQ